MMFWYTQRLHSGVFRCCRHPTRDAEHLIFQNTWGHPVLYKLPVAEHSALVQIRPQGLGARTQNTRGKQSTRKVWFKWLTLWQKRARWLRAQLTLSHPNTVLLVLLSLASFFLFSANQVPAPQLRLPETPLYLCPFYCSWGIPLEKTSLCIHANREKDHVRIARGALITGFCSFGVFLPEISVILSDHYVCICSQAAAFNPPGWAALLLSIAALTVPGMKKESSTHAESVRRAGVLCFILRMRQDLKITWTFSFVLDGHNATKRKG